MTAPSRRWARPFPLIKPQFEELVGLYATGQVTARDWMAARNPIEARIRDTQRGLAVAADTSAFDGPLGDGRPTRPVRQVGRT